MPRLAPTDNLVLIAMPGAGKSTIGVLLAKALARPFLDTDLVIQAQEGRRLRDILAERGREVFCALEEGYVLSLDVRGHVIATGGSVVYSPAAMLKLKAAGLLVYLDLPYEQWLTRVADPEARGVVMEPHQDLRALYAERKPLYRCHADIVVSTEGLSHEDVVHAVLAAVVR